MIGIRSHFNAGSAALAIETREEKRCITEIISELPTGTAVTVIAAPSGILKCARTGRSISQTSGTPTTNPNDPPITGLPAAYQWASNAPARVLVVLDFHVLVNNPGHWRALLEARPSLWSPRGQKATDHSSLVIFIGPAFELTPQNPLRGALQILPFAPPDRDSIAATAAKLQPIPPEIKESVIDALCGLSADSAEQAAAETLARGQGWNVPALQQAKIRELKSAGLEYWEPAAELGGLSGLQTFAEDEVFPWLRDPQLSVRRILCAGLPGTGKSYCARWFGHKLSAPIVRLSIPSLKAGIVGASEGNLRRALRTVDAQESRFQARFFYDLPTHTERLAIAKIHLARVECKHQLDSTARAIADYTDGFSSREIGTQLIPSIARTTKRKPTSTAIAGLCAAFTPASRTQGDQLAQMRRAAATLRRANDEDNGPAPSPRGRQVTTSE